MKIVLVFVLLLVSDIFVFTSKSILEIIEIFFPDSQEEKIRKRQTFFSGQVFGRQRMEHHDHDSLVEAGLEK